MNPTLSWSTAFRHNQKMVVRIWLNKNCPGGAFIRSSSLFVARYTYIGVGDGFLIMLYLYMNAMLKTSKKIPAKPSHMECWQCPASLCLESFQDRKQYVQYLEYLQIDVDVENQKTYRYRLQSNLHKQGYECASATLGRSCCSKNRFFSPWNQPVNQSIWIESDDLKLSSRDFWHTLGHFFLEGGGALCALRKCPLPSHLRPEIAKALTTMTFAMTAAIILTFLFGPTWPQYGDPLCDA